MVMSYANEGTADRVIRIVVGVVLLTLGWGGVVSGTLGAVLSVLAFIPLVTGIVGWCPLYAVAHLSTRSSSDKDTLAAR
jgi:hypothetical protein